MTRLGRLDRSVDGRVALITGAASGMGRATAHVFADEGARVALVDKDGDGVARVAAEIEDSTGSDRVMGRALDVTDRSALERLVQDVTERWGGIDCLVNNAGVSLVSSLLQDEGFEDAWQRTLDVNLTAYVALSRLVVPHMRSRGFGRIVNIASTESIVATAGIAAYSASKAGVTGLTRSMAVELGRHGITVNCICPGSITTDRAISSTLRAGWTDVQAGLAERAKLLPAKRHGQPQEIAALIAYLASEEASYTTGQAIAVDGGGLPASAF